MDWQKIMEQINAVLVALGIPGLGALVALILGQVIQRLGIKVKAERLAFWLDLARAITKELEQLIKAGKITTADAKLIAADKVAKAARRGLFGWLPWNRPKAADVETVVEAAVRELPHK